MATAGASSCYLLSSLIGHGIIHRFFPERAAWFRKEVVKHHKHIFNYLLFLRISPLLPNWFVNLTSPIIGVPFTSFAIATFFGMHKQYFEFTNWLLASSFLLADLILIWFSHYFTTQKKVWCPQLSSRFVLVWLFRNCNRHQTSLTSRLCWVSLR